MEENSPNNNNHNQQQTHLPEQVELMISRIRVEKNQPPLKDYARKMLAEIGEQASIELLNKILVSPGGITSFGGFVSYLVKKEFPVQAGFVLSAYQSPSSPYASPSVSSNGISINSEHLQSPISSHSMNSTPSNLQRTSIQNGRHLQSPVSSLSLNSTPSNLQRTSAQNGEHLESPVSSLSLNSTPSNLQRTSSQNVEHLQFPMASLSLNSTPSDLQRTSPQTISCKLSFEDEDQGRRMPSVHKSSHSGGFTDNTKPMTISRQLMILRDLQFRKLFLLLSYIRRQRLEEAITVKEAEEISSMKDSSMTAFEAKIWNKFGQKFCDESDRIQYLDWDSGKTHLYYCHVHGDGSYYFKGPYLNSTRTHLQKSLGDDNVLIVKFLEDGIGNIAEEGLLVGLRRYRFFVFKNERNKPKKNQTVEEKKAVFSPVNCYFVRIESVAPDGDGENYILSGKSISEARRLFMHIHTVSTIEKYMARFSLILSKTIKLQIDFGAIIVEKIEDIPFRDENGSIMHDEDGKPLLHTDGTGYISEDLAMKCPKAFSASKYIKDNSFEKNDVFVDSEHIACQKSEVETRTEAPLLMQCRLFYDGYAVKGTLLVNRKLEPGTIQIRPSMIKVESDRTLPVGETFDSLEIVAISHRPGRTCFSKYLIALLNYGGVPEEFFLTLLKEALEETKNVYSNRRAALRVACMHEGRNDGSLALRMISSGVPLNEPYLQHCLSNLESGEKTKLKKGKIPISESFYLIGTADPTGILNNDEVCVILENGQISGKVLVYRNPGMHFGDVHIMEAKYVKELEEVVGNAKYGIFFSVKGSRSAAYEIATGDFDGDLYWVSRNPELLKYFKAHDPWKRVYSVPNSQMRSPKEFSDVQLECKLFRLFLESRRPSFEMATAADCWFTLMDRLLILGNDRTVEKNRLKSKMMKLIDIYYDALDAPKSGKKVKIPNELRAEMFPHHMEKGTDSYHSSSVLGQIYDKVQAYQNEAVPKTEIWKLSCFEVSIPPEYVIMWSERYDNYRNDMREAMKLGEEVRNAAANDVIKKYKEMLYEAPEMEVSAKSTEVIYEEALAIYRVTYDYAKSHGVEKCNFAWRVAGSALCDYHAWKLGSPKERPLVILPSILRDLLN